MMAMVILSTFAAALACPFLFRVRKRHRSWLVALLPLAITAYLARLLPPAAAGEPATFSLDWAAEFGLQFSFRADGLGLFFALLISGIGALVVVYAGGYLGEDPNVGRFYAWLFVFIGAMLGVALADNLLLLFIFWELTSLSSFMLIGYEHEKETARAAALQALLVTGGGGLAMLAGIILIWGMSGTLELSSLLSNGMAFSSHPFFIPALILILLGAFTKSAQFPFHFWLPNAMAAPTPVSAYLHSATMVKAGVYLLARLAPLFGGNDVWMYLVGGVGLLTMLVGSYLSFLQTDLKRLLAYSTVSALGAMTMLLGLGAPLAAKAAVVFLLAHALYKGALFLVAGVIDHETGSRDITQLRGLFRALPITGAAGGVAALSMMGIPPLFGFVAKEVVYETGLAFNPWLMAAIVFMGLSAVYVAAAGIGPFWGALKPTPKERPHEAPFSMWLGSVLLAVLSLLAGIAPGGVASLLVSPAVSSIQGEAISVKLALWHGLNSAFLLSVGTALVGLGLFAAQHRLRGALQKFTWTWGPLYFYERSLAGMLALAKFQTRALQSGTLRYYLIAIVGTVILGGSWTLARVGGLNLWPTDVLDVRFHEAALAVLILGAALAAVTSPSRLGAIAALGAAGIGVALLFLIFGAPDLAMTQFAIESLTVILFVLAFYHLPKFKDLSPMPARIRDAILALLAGGLMSVLALVAIDTEIAPSISRFYAANSLLKAYGRNIVNVILVDFRGLDTLGEITVLGVAGIGVYALLKFRKSRAKNED